MILPPNARAEGLTRMGPIRLKGRGLISRSVERSAAEPRASESCPRRTRGPPLVRNRERTLESLRLVRKIVPSGHGDEFLRPLGDGRSLPRDFEEIVPPEVHFLRSNRLELPVGVPPASLLIFHAFIPPCSSEASAARDGEPRNRPNRYKSSRANRAPDRPRKSSTAPLNSAGPSCANGCSASVAARFSKVVSVLVAAHRRWPRPPRRASQWDGRARAAAPCFEEISARAAASRRRRGPTGRLRLRPEDEPSSRSCGRSPWSASSSS